MNGLILEICIAIVAAALTAWCFFVTSENHPKRIEKIIQNWAPVAHSYDGD